MHTSSLAAEIFELVKYDRLNELTEVLSENKNSFSVLNYENNEKETPLHVAASKHSFDCMQLLLEYGARPDMQDMNGRTPLLNILLKLKDCDCDACTRRAAKCINLLGEFNADMNISDHNHETPLYLAADLQAAECASSLLDNGAEVGLHQGKPMLAILLERIPSIILSVLDRSVEVGAKAGIHEADCEVTFDLGVLLPTQAMTKVKCSAGTSREQKNGNNGQHDNTITINTPLEYKPEQEMLFLNNLLDSGDEDSRIYKAILHHPLVNVFTDIKWKRLELLFYSFLLLQLSVLAAYTILIFLTIFKDCPYDFVLKALQVKEALIRSNLVDEKSALLEPICGIGIATKVISAYVLFCTLIVLMKEIQHAIMDWKEYIKDLLNYIQLVGLAAIIATILIAWDPDSEIYLWLYPSVASFGMGISWCQIFIQIGRLPQLAIYVDMFAKIAVNFCWSLCIYSLILVGFAMSYCVLFPTAPHLIDIPLALVRVLTMMVGELDYEGLFPEETNITSIADITPYQRLKTVSAHLWYVIFVIMVTLVLMNLLVGLAVSDIHGCKKNAEMVVIKRRIRYITYLESSFYLATRFTPNVLKNFLRLRIGIGIPRGETLSSCKLWRRCNQVSDVNCFRVRPNDSKDNVLSHESKKSIKYWVMVKGKSNANRKCNYRKSPNITLVDDRNSRDISSAKKSATPSHNTAWNQGDQTTAFSSSKIELSIQRLERRLAEMDSKIDIFFKKMSKHLTHD